MQRYPLNQWYCAATAAELECKPIGRIFLNQPVVLYRREDGSPVALADACCHRHAPLHSGTVEGDNIRCGYHGLLFDTSGRCVWMPGQAKVPASARVRSYAAAERHGWIWIWMGDPEQADPEQIMDCFACTDPAWASVSGMVKINSDAMLVVDNLMDLSHVAFVHRATIGSEEDCDPDLLWEHGEDWVSGTRAAFNLSPAPVFESMGMTGHTDQTKVMTYLPAANVIVDIKITSAGSEFGKGSFNSHQIIYNMMTPETETTCHYFYAATRNYRIDDEELTNIITQNNIPLLIEDKAIIEATQQMQLLNGNKPMISFVADTGSVLSRRILERRVKAEMPREAAMC